MKSRNYLFLISLAVAIVMGGCSTTPKKSPEDHRQAIISMRDDTLTALYKLKDSAKAEVASAPGYAVFNSAGLKLGVVGAGGGRGVVVDNRSSKNTYMNMAELGAGIGLGVKNIRVVFIFHNDIALDDFITNGVTIGASANASAKLNDEGKAGSGEVVVNNMSVYQITDAGLALEMMVSGTKYWSDSSLN